MMTNGVASSPDTPRHLGYRPDIDGLRAVAVALVVAFHVGVPGFAGGFIGVDVFFVVSGFLITGLLLDEIRSTGTIALARFYARRVRRLLPALALVLAATLVLGSLLLLPVTGEQQYLAKSALAAALSVSNLYFWDTINYFSAHSDLMPLLHTWSLSVEEQYYLVWPALLIGLMRLARGRRQVFMRWLLAALLVIGVATFALSLWATDAARLAAFYLMPMRAWEFALGGVLTLAAGRIASWPRALRLGLFLVSMVALGLSVLLLDHDVAFPGTIALLPTLATAGVIAAGCGAGIGPWQSWLASRGMVAIGLLSYSWYLWHWPLLALARTVDLGQRDLPRDSALAVLALALAWLTYHLVEQPIRRQQLRFFQGTWRTLASGAGMLFAVLIGAAGLGLAARHASFDAGDAWRRTVASAVTDWPRATDTCMKQQYQPFVGLSDDAACRTRPGEPVRIVLWGDSHANHLFPLMERASLELHADVRELSRASCPPLLGVVPFYDGAADHECGRFNDAAIVAVERLARQGLEGIVLAGRWGAYLDQPSADGSPYARLSYGERSLDAVESRQALQAGLDATIERLRRAGLRVVVVGQIPEFRYAVPQCLLRRAYESCAMTRPEVEARRAAVMEVLARSTMQAGAGVRLADPLDFFCDDGLCHPIRGAVVMYSDAQHLTARGARHLEPQLLPALRWLRGEAGGSLPRAGG